MRQLPWDHLTWRKNTFSNISHFNPHFNKITHFNPLESVTKDHLSVLRFHIFMASGLVFRERFYNFLFNSSGNPDATAVPVFHPVWRATIPLGPSCHTQYVAQRRSSRSNATDRHYLQHRVGIASMLPRKSRIEYLHKCILLSLKKLCEHRCVGFRELAAAKYK